MLKVVSKKGCGLCMTVKAVLKKKKEAYMEYDAESDEGGIILNIAKSRELPILLLDDGTSYSGMNSYNYVKTL
jgi:glutaredoxin